MALARVESSVLCGIDAVPCTVEVDAVDTGLQKTTLVGLAQAATKESVERTRRAIQNCGHPVPRGRTLINLAPADLKKDAAALDLPVSVGLMLCCGSVVGDRHRQYLIAGRTGPRWARPAGARGAVDGDARPRPRDGRRDRPDRQRPRGRGR